MLADQPLIDPNRPCLVIRLKDAFGLIVERRWHMSALTIIRGHLREFHCRRAKVIWLFRCQSRVVKRQSQIELYGISLFKRRELTQDFAKRLSRFGFAGLQLTNAQMIVRVGEPTVGGVFRYELRPADRRLIKEFLLLNPSATAYSRVATGSTAAS